MTRNELDKLAIGELDAVYRSALDLSGQPDEAWDLVQEVYLKALRDGPNGWPQRPARVRMWLLGILEEVHASATVAAEAIPLDDDTERDATLPEEPSTFEDIDWEHVDERLHDAIAEMQPHYRRVLLLWAVEDLKYREIANVLQVPIGTVMSRLHRARSILGERLQPLNGERGRVGA